jgi:hypothetical protein
MTNPKEAQEAILKAIVERSLTSGQLSTSAWSATTAPGFRELPVSPHPEEAAKRPSRTGEIGASWFETRSALLTMRI